MSSENMGTYSVAGLEVVADQVKTSILHALCREGLIEDKVADRWCASHTIVLRKKGFFRTFSDWWKKDKEDSGHLIHVIFCKSAEANYDEEIEEETKDE